MRVPDSDGRTWRVGRRWLPWRRKIRHLPDTPWDLDLPDGADDPITAAISLIFLVIALVVLLPVLLALIGLLVELVLLVMLGAVGVALRVALRRPWTVQVVAPDHDVVHTERVVGWRSSRARIEELAAEIRGADTARPGPAPA